MSIIACQWSWTRDYGSPRGQFWPRDQPCRMFKRVALKIRFYLYHIPYRKNVGKQGWTKGKVGLWCSYHTASLGQPCSVGRMTFQNFPGLGQWDWLCPLASTSLGIQAAPPRRGCDFGSGNSQRGLTVSSAGEMLPLVLKGGLGWGPWSQLNRLLKDSAQWEELEYYNMILIFWFIVKSFNSLKVVIKTPLYRRTCIGRGSLPTARWMISTWSRTQHSFFPKLLLFWFCFLNTLRNLSHRFSKPGPVQDWPQTGWIQARASLLSARLRAGRFLTVSSRGLGWSLAHNEQS